MYGALEGHAHEPPPEDCAHELPCSDGTERHTLQPSVHMDLLRADETRVDDETQVPDARHRLVRQAAEEVALELR